MKAKVALPSKEHEKEALEAATNYFRHYAANLTTEGSKLLRKYWAPILIRDADCYVNTANPIIAGDLREICAARLERGEPLSEALRGFVAEFLRNPGKRKNTKRGPSGGDLAMRDLTIAGWVHHIVDKWNFPATRNAASNHPSAASIVQKALKRGAEIDLKESQINKIWRRYKVDCD